MPADGSGGPGEAGAAVRRPLRELMDDGLLDALPERSRDSAGGLRQLQALGLNVQLSEAAA